MPKTKDPASLQVKKAEALEAKLTEVINILLAASSLDDWCTPAQAAKHLSMSADTIYEYISKGVFLLGDELINIGPANAKKPTHRINVRRFLERMEAEQKPLGKVSV